MLHLLKERRQEAFAKSFEEHNLLLAGIAPMLSDIAFLLFGILVTLISIVILRSTTNAPLKLSMLGTVFSLICIFISIADLAYTTIRIFIDIKLSLSYLRKTFND